MTAGDQDRRALIERAGFLDAGAVSAEQRRDRVLARYLAALVVLQAAVFAFVLWATIIRAPFEDMLSWLDAYRRYRETGGLLPYLLQFFAEHRLVWVRVLTAIDASVFQSSGLAFIAVGTIALAGVAVLLTREFVRSMPAHGPLAALAWLCPMLVLTAANAVDCSVPVNIVYPLTVLFVAGACVLFDGAGEADRHERMRRGGAIVLAAGAGLANAVGLLAWPVLLWSAWRGRARWRWLAAIAMVGGGYGLAYLHGVVLAQGVVAPPASTFGQLGKLAGYLLAYLGLPLSRVPALRLEGEGFGAVLLIAGV